MVRQRLGLADAAGARDWGRRPVRARSAEAASLEVSLHSHGLSLDRLDQPARVRVAQSLVSSARALRDEYQASADRYEIGYASSLSELIEMLSTEMKDI